MAGYLAVACYVALLAVAVWWLLYGRKAMLEQDPTYARALRLLDRAEALLDKRRIRVTAPTRACRRFYGWDEMLSQEQAAGLQDRARGVQAESLAIRRELAEVVMQAGHSVPWRRCEVMHLVHMIEDASGPDFLIDYGYEGQTDRRPFRVPVMSVYMDGRDAE